MKAAFVVWSRMQSTIRLMCTPRLEKQCLVEPSLTDWKRSRPLLIKSTSVQHGVKHLRNVRKTPKVGEQEFQVVDLQ